MKSIKCFLVCLLCAFSATLFAQQAPPGNGITKVPTGSEQSGVKILHIINNPPLAISYLIGKVVSDPGKGKPQRPSGKTKKPVKP